MLLQTLRDTVRRRLRSGASTTRFGDIDLDDAILAIGNDFVSRTRCTRRTNTVTLTANLAAFGTNGTGLELFRPEYLIDDPKVWITVSGAFTASVEVVDRDRIYEKQLQCPQTGAPTSCNALVSFLRNDAGTTAGTIYPTPDAVATYILNLMWDPPFALDNAGALTQLIPGSTTTNYLLNIPDEFLIPCVEMMAYTVEGNQIEPKKRDPTVAQRYEAHVLRNMGSGNFGVTSIQRESITSLRRERWG